MKDGGDDFFGSGREVPEVFGIIFMLAMYVSMISRTSRY